MIKKLKELGIELGKFSDNLESSPPHQFPAKDITLKKTGVLRRLLDLEKPSSFARERELYVHDNTSDIASLSKSVKNIRKGSRGIIPLQKETNRPVL